MTKKILPRYPIYIPSKGRADKCLTGKFLIDDGVPFKLVIEEQEYDQYAKEFGKKRLLVLPFSNAGSVIPARNWIKEYSIEQGEKRHWQLDDNIRYIMRWYKGKRVYCRSGIALAAAEDFTERYTNVALTGLNYVMFGVGKQPPFYINHRVYSCTLFLNSLPYMWRGIYNEDADMCLQVLSGDWCTVLINAFLIFKRPTMTVKGGNTDEIYQGDGRAKMSRALERLWPGVVTTGRRFRRPQHKVVDEWRKFDTPLKLKPGLSLDKLDKPNEYGMKLVQTKDTIKGEDFARLIKEEQEKNEAD